MEQTNMDENTYCIILNISEGTDFDINHFKKNGINEEGLILKVSLNGVEFELDGVFSQPNSIIINSNCIWECELDDIKRIKMENRPIKLECFFKSDYYRNEYTKRLGLLLIPLRRVKILNCLSNLQIKPIWYKLNYLISKCCPKSPQICITLSIVKKSILDLINLDDCMENYKSSTVESPTTVMPNTTTTLSMLLPQKGIFVKLLEEVGQIQIGSDSDVDFEIFSLTITFLQIKNILDLLNLIQSNRELDESSFIFQYDFLGNISNIEIMLNSNDSYMINQKISLIFRSTLKNLRMYFERIFFIPVYLYYNREIAIAKCNFDISSFIPDDIQYFNEMDIELWTSYGSFYFDIISKITNPGVLQPVVEFMITLKLLFKNVKEYQQHDVKDYNQKLQKQPSKIENDLVKYNIHSVTERGKKSLSTITENLNSSFKIQEKDKLYFHYLEHFNNWKQHQIIYFLIELSRINSYFMNVFQYRWKLYSDFLIALLQTKIEKYDLLIVQLESMQHKLNILTEKIIEESSNVDNIKREISSYKNKITLLEMEIKTLRKENEMKIHENIDLRKYINHLEKQLTIKSSHLHANQLKDILNDMRNQADRFATLERFYTKQWFNEANKMKNKISKLVTNEQEQTNLNVSYGPEDIINDDIGILNTNNIEFNENSSFLSEED